jgi:hypothetical protein
MSVEAIEKNFWQGLKTGITVFAGLTGEEFLTCPLRAHAEGEGTPLWLLAPRDTPLLRRLHRNDNGIVTAVLDEAGIAARVAGKMKLVEDTFSVQRVGRFLTLPWAQSALSESALLRFDVSSARFWLAGRAEPLEAKLDAPRLPAVTAEIVHLGAAPLKAG